MPAATTSRGSMSQRPSDATRRESWEVKDKPVMTSGSARTPSLFASKSPSALAMASPGKLRFFAKTRRTTPPSPPRTVTARTTPPCATILLSASASSLWSWVAKTTKPFRVMTTVESPTCAVVTFCWAMSINATVAVVPDSLHNSSCCANIPWHIVNTRWKPETGPAGSSAIPTACCSKTRFTCAAMWCPCSPWPSNTATRSRSPGNAVTRWASWLTHCFGQLGFSPHTV
mmetsp:Transcript_98041/g.194075  ORF Transcript_98041/g.194075 Transcript_98041/m.194075 type:complete len:230 (+) Transcript_98041:315-1004(+)